MKKQNSISTEVRERAARLVQEQHNERPSVWATCDSIAPEVGCISSALFECFKRSQIDQGKLPSVSKGESEHIKKIEVEVKELRPTQRRVTRQIGRPNWWVFFDHLVLSS